MGVCQPFFQPVGLYLQNLLAAALACRRVGRYERFVRDAAGQPGFCGWERKGGVQDAFVLMRREGGHPAALPCKLLDIYFADRQAGAEPPALGQDHTVFRDQVMPGKDHIGGRFPLARIGVEIAADQTSRMSGNQTAAVIRLSDRLVACRKVDDHRCTRFREPHRRRLGRPEVLTDLHTKPAGTRAWFRR